MKRAILGAVLFLVACSGNPQSVSGRNYSLTIKYDAVPCNTPPNAVDVASLLFGVSADGFDGNGVLSTPNQALDVKWSQFNDNSVSVHTNDPVVLSFSLRPSSDGAALTGSGSTAVGSCLQTYAITGVEKP